MSLSNSKFDEIKYVDNIEFLRTIPMQKYYTKLDCYNNTKDIDEIIINPGKSLYLQLKGL
jgi:hypothetical protein